MNLEASDGNLNKPSRKGSQRPETRLVNARRRRRKEIPAAKRVIGIPATELGRRTSQMSERGTENLAMRKGRTEGCN